jgi:hypothetical protein
MSGESPDEQLRGGDVNPGFGARDGSLEILGQPAVSIEPSESPFDDPSVWQQLKPVASAARLTISMVQSPNLTRASRRWGPL